MDCVVLDAIIYRPRLIEGIAIGLAGNLKNF